MCTAITLNADSFYFGRTLDNDCSYDESVTVAPKNYEFKFTNGEILKRHYAIIGMAYVSEGYPLYYDAVNEKGLCMAGLNFPDNAVYFEPQAGKLNVAQFELVPFVLSKCGSLAEAEEILNNINITNISFNEHLPTAPLHWMIADKSGAVTVESTQDGLHIYCNPAGVLTNSPVFPYHMMRLNDCMNLTAKEPYNRFSDKLNLKPYCKGMGAIGLPGDLSSQSRFVRAAYSKLNSVTFDSEQKNVEQFFHILGTVEQVTGCCDLGDGRYETTVYTSCCNANKGIYYYTTYFNRRITAVDMHKCDLEGSLLTNYFLKTEADIMYMN